MTLREFLLHYTKVNEYVVIYEGGWRVGMTWIDNEDLFINSLNPTILDKEVVTSKTKNLRDGLKVLAVDLH